MFRPVQRNARRKPSQEAMAAPLPQQKKTNHIKTRMQSKNLPVKDTNRATKFTNHTNLPNPGLLLAKEKLTLSQEDTKVSQQEESFTLEEKPSRSGNQKGRSNAQLQAYGEQINEYVLKREQKYMIDEGYLRHHRLLNVKLRSYLVKYIFRISHRFELLRTTTYLAVHYMDTYFSKVHNFKDQYETVAVAQACLFMAMKYEQIYPPELGEWVDHRHKPEVVSLEAKILMELDFQLAHYTIEHFLHFNLWKEAGEEESPRPTDRTLLLMDLSLFDLRMRQFRPSQLAKCFHLMGQMQGHSLSTEDVNGMEQKEAKMIEHIGWMIETYQDALKWLVDNSHYNTNLLLQ